MKDNPATTATISDRALELIMRDVLDGLFELSLESSLCADIADFEILEIRPAISRNQHRRVDSSKADAEIIDFPNLKRACG
ncbi:MULTISPECIES: hypothetical protein [Sedimenticola]|uniref:hypothetical protein n=1 Tax=Sedimenticola TaxID=349742 RepID=UPI00048D5D46|nr:MULTISPECIES: hypothetical protein [Sedimenticola]MCW8904259.1 integration host factor subunit beta [Sedimenticola sp.]